MIVCEAQLRFGNVKDVIQLRQVAESSVRRSWEEPGCLDFFLSVDMLDSCMVTVGGKWLDWAHFEAHMKQAYMRKWRAKLNEHAEGHAMQIYEVNETRQVKDTNLFTQGASQLG